MSAIETVWTRMKAYAAEHAATGERSDEHHAEATVIRFMHEANVAPWPPPRVISYFANELIAMIEHCLLAPADA